MIDILKTVETDFIILTQLTNPIIKGRIKQLLDRRVIDYYYPDNLCGAQNFETTLILSKRPVKFGCIKYKYEELNEYSGYNSFFEMQVLKNGVKRKFTLLAVDLRGTTNNNLHRRKKLQSIVEFGRGSYLFSAQGSYDIGSS